MDKNMQQFIRLAGLLAVVFIVQKLFNQINWSWWWVCSPLLMLAALFIIALIVVLIQNSRK